MAQSTALVARAKGAVARVFRPFTKQAIGGGYLLPLGGGYIPASWPLNYWQAGYDPLRAGGGAVVYACIAAYAQTTAMCPGTIGAAPATAGASGSPIPRCRGY